MSRFLVMFIYKICVRPLDALYTWYMGFSICLFAMLFSKRCGETTYKNGQRYPQRFWQLANSAEVIIIDASKGSSLFADHSAMLE